MWDERVHRDGQRDESNRYKDLTHAGFEHSEQKNIQLPATNRQVRYHRLASNFVAWEWAPWRGTNTLSQAVAVSHPINVPPWAEAAGPTHFISDPNIARIVFLADVPPLHVAAGLAASAPWQHAPSCSSGTDHHSYFGNYNENWLLFFYPLA
jgi:hypothetical protein